MARRRPIPPEDRRARLERALASSDPLGAVNAIVDESTPLGRIFRRVFACILETNSAELLILFDRYDDEYLRDIEDALEAIQATRTLEDYRRLKQAFDAAVASGLDRLDASDAVASTAELAVRGRQYQAHVAEMEQQLTSFCRAHVREL
jgi:hypothetical protein